MLTKIINDETKKCLIVNQEIAKAMSGLSETEVEQGYDGNLYLKGFAPETPIELVQKKVRSVRDQYLAETDKYMIADFPVTEEKREQYKIYRQYLRDYTKGEE